MCFRDQNQPPPPGRRPRIARGFTLIEVIVAVVLIDVGLLSLVAGSTVLIRRAAESRAATAVLQAANNRLETIAGSSCATANIATGVAIGAGLREAWAIEARPAGTRELRDSVTYTVQGRAHSIVMRTRIPC
jgi:prepilin-type N-terminal cleavage/methylation domain-containing protein